MKYVPLTMIFNPDTELVKVAPGMVLKGTVVEPSAMVLGADGLAPYPTAIHPERDETAGVVVLVSLPMKIFFLAV